MTVHREIFAEPNREYFVVGSELSREDLDAPYVGTKSSMATGRSTGTFGKGSRCTSADSNRKEGYD